jgi:hypothetical protein
VTKPVLVEADSDEPYLEILASIIGQANRRKLAVVNVVADGDNRTLILLRGDAPVL